MQFSAIPAHFQLKTRLMYLAKRGQVPHANLFWGPPGSACLTLALAFATYLSCQNKLSADSCGACTACHKMHNLQHPDVRFTFPIHTIKASSETEITSNNFLKLWYPFVQTQPYGDVTDWSHHLGLEHKQLLIPKAEATYISQYVTMQPFESSYKIILVWLPEYLHLTAANAMLKILEDPPQKIIFLLVSAAPERVLSTLSSRLQQMYVPAFTDKDIQQMLLRQHPLSVHKIMEVVGLAEGNLHKAYKLLEESKDGLLESLKSWMRSCYAQDFTKLMEQVEKFQEIQKEHQKHFLAYALHMIRQTLIMQFTKEKLLRSPEEEQQFAEKLGQTLDYDAVKQISMWLSQAHYHIERNLNPKILFLNLSLRIVQIFQDIREKSA